MDPLHDLLATDQPQTLHFFIDALREVAPGHVSSDPGHRELLYTASILAHYALVSSHSTSDLPLANTLRQLFEQYVVDTTAHHNPELMEGAAAQSLLLTGYFGEGMERRHSVRAYSEWGKRFFEMSAVGRRRDLLLGMSQHYEPWRDTLRDLHGFLHDRRYLLELN
jgi:hypothetical protein